MKINLPIKVVVRGKISLGPVPGTPEHEIEQRERAARGLPVAPGFELKPPPLPPDGNG